MMLRRSFSLVSVIALGSLGASLSSLPGCTAAQLSAAVPQILGGIEDAGLILGQVGSFVTAYAQANPAQAAVVAKIQAAISDAQAALDAVVRVGQTVTDVTNANFQAALADFESAFAAVVSLATQIGVQVSESATSGYVKATPATATAPAKLVVAKPLLLGLRAAARAR